jgi:hypothetical protein
VEQLGAWIAKERERLSDEAYFACGGALVPDAAAYADFNELMAPLEERTGQPLKGPNRTKCLRVFISSPEAFRRMTEDALRPGNRSPVAVLVRMVNDGDHVWNPEAA